MKLMVILTTALLVVGPVVAQDLMVYPAKNQSNDQMEKDKLACSSWAKTQTNFDPSAPQAAPSQAPQKSVAGNAAKGSARGAAVGTGIGVISGGPAKGAA